VNKYYH